MKKFFNFRPIVFGAICLALGVVASVSSAYIGVWSYLIAVAAIFAPITAFYIIKKNVSRVVTCVIYLALFSIGFLLLLGYIRVLSFGDQTIVGARIDGVVEKINPVTMNGYENHYLILKNVLINGVSIDGNVFLYESSSGIERGDAVYTSVALQKISDPFSNLFLLENRVAYVGLDVTSVYLTEKGSGLSNIVINGSRDLLLEEFAQNQAGTMIALLFGDTQYIDDALLDSYQMAGISHIFAVSGLHIGFFYTILSFLFDKIGVKRYYNTLLVTLVSAVYAYICSSVSAYRAVVMCFIYGLGKSFGNKQDSLNSIFLSMAIVLLLFPTSIFGVGFLLSYGAVISIALFSKPFQRLFSFLPKKLGDSFGVSLAVFAGTMPVVLLFFNRASIITVLLNIPLVPIVAALYPITMFGLIFSALFGYANVFLYLSNVICLGMNKVMGYIDFSPFLITYQGNYVPIIIYYAVLLLNTDKLNLSDRLRKFALIALPVSALLLV